MFQEVIDLEFPRCQRQSPAPTLISQRSLPGPDGGCNWEPLSRPRDLWGLCPLHLGTPLALHLLNLQGLQAWPSSLREEVSRELTLVGWGGGTEMQMSGAEANGKCPSLPGKL